MSRACTNVYHNVWRFTAKSRHHNSYLHAEIMRIHAKKYVAGSHKWGDTQRNMSQVSWIHKVDAVTPASAQPHAARPWLDPVPREEVWHASKKRGTGAACGARGATPPSSVLPNKRMVASVAALRAIKHTPAILSFCFMCAWQCLDFLCDESGDTEHRKNVVNINIQC